MVRGRQAAGVSPERYLRVVLVAGVLLTLIIFTGAAVRLTESGLGCEDWPACSSERAIPEIALHPWIEFGNRLLSGVVALGTVAAVLMAYRRTPRRPDLIRWAWYLVIGVVAQVILGAITVKVELHPLVVSLHFLLSIVLIWQAVVLWYKASGGIGTPRPLVSPALEHHSLATVAAAAAILVTGTFVTGTGPNSGDFRADRLNLDLTTVARVHSITAWLFLALLVSLVVRLQRSGHPLTAASPALVAALAQGAIGYLQYAKGVPPGLVMLHIIGAVTLWLLVLRLHMSLYQRPDEVGGIAAKNTSGAPRYEANFIHGG